MKLIRDAIIPATAEKFIRVKWKTGNGLVQAELAPDTLLNYPGIFVAKARVIPNSPGELQIALINTTDSDLNLKRRKYLGRLTPCSLTVPEIACINSFNQTKIVMGEETPTVERQELLGLLNDFKDVFAENPKKPKLVTNTTHKIVPVSTPLIFRKPYPIPYARRDEVNSQLQEMLQNEVIRPSHSPWNAPVLLVKKKDNSLRFVCDFRSLNDVTIKDTYPLPRISEIIDKMSTVL